MSLILNSFTLIVKFCLKTQNLNSLTLTLNSKRNDENMTVFSGCYTALVTPMTSLREVDYEGLKSLVEFQVREGVNGLLAVGTTGESPTLDWNEHNRVIERTKEYASERCLTIAGSGSNSTQEKIKATAHAHHVGVNCVLLVDPYYNGPRRM